MDWTHVRYSNMTAGQRDRYENYIRTRRSRPTARYPGDWMGGRLLGRGGNGIANLWVERGAYGRIVDRVVVKDIQMAPADYADDDNYMMDRRKREPREYFIAKILRSVMPRQHIVRARNYQLSSQRDAWRLYLEFCDHQDIDDLIRRHRNAHRPRAIPETFIWWVFESLAIAACDMDAPPNLDPARGDPPNSQVIHQDLKTGNVFLGAANATEFRTYPEPKLGDFGSGRLTNPLAARADNPRWPRLKDAHTEGYDPPELFDRRYNPGVFARRGRQAQQLLSTTWVRLLSHTNNWQIARVMLAMMRLETRPPQIDYYVVPRPTPAGATVAVWPMPFSAIGADPWVPDVDAIGPGPVNIDVAATYSQALRNLVNDCLQANPAHRPTPAALRAACTAAIAADPNVNAVRHRAMPFPSNHRDRVVGKYSRRDNIFAMGRLARNV
ncbi:hypothetical protein AAFC00_003789 [Neodothiora populina]|uniref:non-specific serine/threonine protein kinase n=1 Tax=Neodothiora populina TaxID=2781224 RepID=A0ABR3PFM0_9PEZI